MADPLQGSPYEVVRRLAVGGMGEVLLARSKGDARISLSPGLVVVKRTIPSHPSRAHQDRMLKEEGRLGLRLRHANIVETFALDEVEGAPILVMEYLAGRSMAQVLGAAKRNAERLPVDVALAIVRLAACGLHFAHTLTDGVRALGLVHRDVSPANIFVTFDGAVKVIDFGVAKADDSEIKTSTGVLKGKIGYMAPEHTRGEKLDPRADLWSLGVFLWESLIADRLFSTQNPAQALHRINHAPIPAPSSLRPDVPASVDAIVMRLLTRPREDRVRSAAELVRLIDALPDVRWDRADLASFVRGRFPDDADRGMEEVRNAARVSGVPIPSGLVEGSTLSRDDLDAATVVANRRDLIRLARLAAGPAISDDSDDDGRTLQLGPGLRTEDDEAPVDPMRTIQVAAPVGADIDSEMSTEGGSPQSARSATTGQTANLRPAEVSRSKPPVEASGPVDANRPKKRRRTTPVEAALLTFGALAIVMGGVFISVAEGQRPEPIYVAVVDGGAERIIALVDLPPDPNLASRRITLGDLRFRVGADRPFLTADPVAFEAALDESGVAARARLPQTPRARLAAALPPAILLLGFLALSVALPTLVLRGGALAGVRTVLLVVGFAAGAIIARQGALTWPGLDALQRQGASLDARTLKPATTTGAPPSRSPTDGRAP